MVFNGVVSADDAVQPSYGLFSVARVQNRGPRDENWISGFYVESVTCGLNAKIVPQCVPADEWISVFDNSDGVSFFRVAPFGIIESYECDNSIGFTAIDRRAVTVNQLKTITEYAVERELWVGENAQAVAAEESDDYNPDRYLANAIDATPNPGVGVKPKVALAVLEQNFGENNPGVQPVIHMTPLMAVMLDDVISEDGDQLVTTSGSKVVISRGGVGEEGPHAGGGDTTHWMYATGPVHVDLGGGELITVSAGEIVDAKTNKVRYVAERPAAVYFDGCAWFGVLADATL